MPAITAYAAEAASLPPGLLNHLLSLDIGACVAVIGLDRSSVWLARATGAEVSVMAPSVASRAAAVEMGADHYFPLSDPMTFRALEGAFDLIIAPPMSDRRALLGLLKPGAQWVSPDGRII